MRISDWSSDVCSSDLRLQHGKQADRLEDVAIAVAHVGSGSQRIRRECPPPCAVARGPGTRRGPNVVEHVGEAIPLVGGVGSLVREALQASRLERSEEHTSELQSLMRISYAVFCLKHKTH